MVRCGAVQVKNLIPGTFWVLPLSCYSTGQRGRERAKERGRICVEIEEGRDTKMVRVEAVYPSCVVVSFLLLGGGASLQGLSLIHI